jgi:hypothetical protein
MARVEIKVQNADEIPKNFEAVTQEMSIGMMDALADVAEKASRIIGTYPPSPEGKDFPFKSRKQQKFLAASIADQSITVPYERSFLARDSWRIWRRPELPGIELTNLASYSGWLFGSGAQGDDRAAFHSGRWIQARPAMEVLLRIDLPEATADRLAVIANKRGF